MFDEPQTNEEKEIAATEKLIFDVQHEIAKSMYQMNVSKAELARRLGCSSAIVSQWLGDGGANLTLKTIAQIFHALEDECSFHSSVVRRAEETQGMEKRSEVAQSYDTSAADTAFRER